MHTFFDGGPLGGQSLPLLRLHPCVDSFKLVETLKYKGISKQLKPTRFVTLFILIAILTNSGDIETNPGPTFSIKTVHGSCHQANPKFGPTASDIDIILDYGNAAYSRLGFVNEYLSFDDIPSTFSMRDHVCMCVYTRNFRYKLGGKYEAMHGHYFLLIYKCVDLRPCRLF